MVAYEFTTEPGADLSKYEDFVAQFSSTVNKFGVQDMFALTAVPICPQDKVLSEFELSHVLSTVLVPDASWLPAQDIAILTSTDWVATAYFAKYADGSVPGIFQLKCIQTRSTEYYNVTCSRTRSGTRTGHAPDPFAGKAPMDSPVTINGEAVQDGTEPHAIITHALKLAEAA